MCIVTLFGALGSLFFKFALNSSNNILRLIKNKYFYLGGVFFLFGFLSYLVFLRRYEVSFIFPMTSLTYIWSTFFSFKYLKEKINLYKIIAVLLIITGVILISF
jgi:uncharacterized membrane protein